MTGRFHPHIAARLFNTALLIHPQKLDAILAGLGGRVLGVDQSDLRGLADASQIPELFSTRRGDRPEGQAYTVVDGVAVMHIGGALVHRSRMDGASNYLLGYNEVVGIIEQAQADPAVHAIAGIFDTPGGEAVGAFEGADRIFSMRGGKPMWAIADSMALSAGYLLASSFDRLIVTPSTGLFGSIGVVMRHVDFSRALDSEGIKVTQVFAGAHKVDGHQFGPLPEAVFADMQARVNQLHTKFAEAVSRGMGLSLDQVFATEARVFAAEDAVAARLAHDMATTDQVIAELAAMRPGRNTSGRAARATANQGDQHMEGSQQVAGPENAAAMTQADVDRARAEGIEQGRKEGAATERARIQSVQAQALPGHEALIASLMWDGVTSGPEAAVKVLAAEKLAGTQRAAALEADTPRPVEFSADNGLGEAAPAAAPIDPKAKAACAAAMVAEAKAAGRPITVAQAMTRINQETAHA